MKKSITILAVLLIAFVCNVKAADIIIDSSASLSETYASATADDVIILGDGNYTVDATISLTKGITIKAQNALQATVIGAGFIFNTTDITDVKFEGLVFDGTKSIDGVMQLYFTDINGATNLNNVTIENCRILNYGNCLLRANRAEAVCNEFKVNNCFIRNFGASNLYPFFQCTKTKFTKLELTNSTITDLVPEFIQFYGTAGGNDEAIILFKNNTFYNVVSSAARKPMSGKSGKLYIQNNIFVKSPVHGTSEITFDASVTTVELTNNVIFDFAEGAFMGAAGWLVNTGNTDVDPGFIDAANYNFTLPTGSALIAANIGDPRWFGTTGVKNLNYNAITVYPNPTADIIYFEKTVSKIEIISLLGKALLTAHNTSECSLANLPNGTYIVRIADNDGNIGMQKISKK
jgi:hypothetical protein